MKQRFKKADFRRTFLDSGNTSLGHLYLFAGSSAPQPAEAGG